MRFTDFNPRWTTGKTFSVPIPLGVSFDCPCCGKQRLSVGFRQPIDPQHLLANTSWQPDSIAWDRTGETFDTLSLLPSIDYSQHGHWHGHIINGEVLTA